MCVCECVSHVISLHLIFPWQFRILALHWTEESAEWKKENEIITCLCGHIRWIHIDILWVWLFSAWCSTAIVWWHVHHSLIGCYCYSRFLCRNERRRFAFASYSPFLPFAVVVFLFSVFDFFTHQKTYQRRFQRIPYGIMMKLDYSFFARKTKRGTGTIELKLKLISAESEMTLHFSWK